ncbi:MAG: zinc-dependent metalloprotease [Bacteroidia bacterium]
MVKNIFLLVINDYRERFFIGVANLCQRFKHGGEALTEVVQPVGMLVILCFAISSAQAQSVLDNGNLTTHKGFFDFHHSDSLDKIYLEVKNVNTDFLYVSALSEGVGSNDLGLDRGQIGNPGKVVSFKKIGNKLLLVQPNLRYRALSENELERKSVEEAFAKSVLFGFPIIEKTDKGYLIELTPFLLQDAHGVSRTLKRKKQGDYSLDLSRSGLNMDRTKSFPKNVEFDALITLKGTPQESEIRSVTPDARYVSVYQHHSFIALPDNNYTPRVYHPNSGTFSVSYMNYSASIDKPMEVQYAVRHRLEKKDPTAAVSEAKEPIIYYLDNGTPEPVRSALLEGASWWNQAFEAIGFKDAFQVKILPDTIDPLDVRYNVIQWVHRSTRGWSYGGGVIDPRTGEMIKGHVSLGSLRVRQDFLIAQALSKAPFANKDADSAKMLEFALARIRQLSAHEVGHTLGFAHNFAASTNDRASVMDYPHPLVTINNGEINIRDAYASGIGAWDKITVAYSYTQFDKNETNGLQKILDEAMTKGYRYVSDADARPRGSANAYGHLWDNGSNAIDELHNVMQVRNLAIDQFGLDNIKDGESFDDLEDLFVLLYFYHRYQTEAAIKSIGGLDYGYRLKGKVSKPTMPIPPAEQQRALEAVLQTIDAKFLATPKTKLELFPARAMGRGRESFATLTGAAFDPMSAAATASSNTLAILLAPERCGRLVLQKSLDEDQLGYSEALDELIKHSLKKRYSDGYLNEIQASINIVVINRLMQLAQANEASAQVKAITNNKLRAHLNYLIDLGKKKRYHAEHIRIIEHYFKHPEQTPALRVPKIPDGSPIGTCSCSHG